MKMPKVAKASKAKTVASLDGLIKSFSSNARRKTFSTGSIIFDKLLGGGYPCGSIIEVGGPPGIGKTTIVLHSMKSICEAGGKCAYLDFEGGVNISQLDGIGLTPYLDDHRFLLLYLQTFKELETALDTLLEEDYDVIAIDSDTAVVPTESLEKSVEDERPGRHAQIVANLLRKYTMKVFRKSKVIVLVSQVRVFLNFTGVSTTKVAGGNAKQHFAHVRMQLREAKKVINSINVLGTQKETQVGSDVEMWANKNRYAAPFVKAPIRVLFGKGVDNVASLMVWLETHRDENGEFYIVKGGGGWTTVKFKGESYRYHGEREVHDWVASHVPDVLTLIDERGGFEVIEESEMSDSSLSEMDMLFDEDTD